MVYAQSVRTIWLKVSVVVLLTVVILHNAEGTGYCTSYCDHDGRYYDNFYCNHNYCCGTALYKICCNNRSLDITGLYPEYYNCDSNSWMQVHWQVMITMTGTVVVVLMFTACCCQCCRLCSEKAQQEHRVRYSANNSTNGTIITDADGNQIILEPGEGLAEGGDPNQVQIQFFNPESPYAFSPPDYSTVRAKEEPPKYNEVFGATGGANLNPCYVPDTPPPPFSPQEQTPGVHSSPAHAPNVNEPIRDESEKAKRQQESDVDAEVSGDLGLAATDGFISVQLSATDVTEDDKAHLRDAPPSYDDIADNVTEVSTAIQAERPPTNSDTHVAS